MASARARWQPARRALALGGFGGEPRTASGPWRPVGLAPEPKRRRRGIDQAGGSSPPHGEHHGRGGEQVRARQREGLAWLAIQGPAEKNRCVETPAKQGLGETPGRQG